MPRDAVAAPASKRSKRAVPKSYVPLADPANPRHPGGRPKARPEITPEITLEICKRLSGGEALKVICRDKSMPPQCEVYRKMAFDAEFETLITRARAAQQHAMADQCVDMADAANAENWQVVRLRIWARQWRAAKLAPKVYGEKLQTEVSGGLSVEGVLREDQGALRAGLLAGLVAAGIAPAIARAVVSAAEADEGELIEGTALPAPDPDEAGEG